MGEVGYKSRLLALAGRFALIALLGGGNELFSQSAAQTAAQTAAQSQSPAQGELQELQKLLTEESKNWSVLSYSQLYLYGKSEPVEYTGTVYLSLGSFALDGCDLTMKVVVQDSYVGVEEQKRPFGGTPVRKETRPLSDTYRYLYRLNLREVEPEQIDTAFARPVQLLENTSLRCSEESLCRLTWLRVVAKTPSIAEIRVLNGFEDVDEKTSQMIVPMTSKESAGRIAAALRQAAAACHGVRS